MYECMQAEEGCALKNMSPIRYLEVAKPPVRKINGSVWIDRGSVLTIHFRQKVNPGDKITINLSASSARQLYDYVSRYSPNAKIKDRP